jgi:hypothetical protein
MYLTKLHNTNDVEWDASNRQRGLTAHRIYVDLDTEKHWRTISHGYPLIMWDKSIEALMDKTMNPDGREDKKDVELTPIDNGPGMLGWVIRYTKAKKNGH